MRKINAIIAALVLVWAGGVQASTQTGQILVKVVTADGVAIEGATLELTGKELIGGARTDNATADRRWSRR
jgi:hypothetical protein